MLFEHGHFYFRIDILRESGIYDEAFRTALNPTRVGPDYTEKLKKDSCKFQDISLIQIEGPLFIYLYFMSLAMLISIWDWYYQLGLTR